MLTVDSVWGSGGWCGGGRGRIKITNKMSPKPANSACGQASCSFFPTGAGTVLETNETFVWGNCIFIWNSAGWIFFSYCCLFPFPIKEGNKSSFAATDSFQTRENGVLGLFFWGFFAFFSPHLSAVVTDCDFMQTNLIVFVVYWYFLLLTQSFAITL